MHPLYKKRIPTTRQRRSGTMKLWFVVAVSVVLQYLPSHAFLPRTVVRQEKWFAMASGIRYAETPALNKISLSSDDETHSPTTNNEVVRKPSLVFVVPDKADQLPSKYGGSSPVDNPSILSAVQHLAQKTTWFADGSLTTKIVLAGSLASVIGSSSTTTDSTRDVFNTVCEADVLVAMGLHTPVELDSLARVFERRRALESAQRNSLLHIAVDCGTTGTDGRSVSPPRHQQQLSTLVGPYDPLQPSLASQFIPWSPDATGRRMHDELHDLWDRWTSDDACYAIVLFLNQFSETPIDWVKHRTDASWEKGAVQNARELYAMVDSCQDCIAACVQDDQCRTCLGKLTDLDPRDQAASYRTLVSYESDLLTNFSLCIFTKHNIFECDAQIPSLPHVEPLPMWRGESLTQDHAKALLIAHLDDEAAPDGSLGRPVSWTVACGANVAYDQFPSQNQLFYPSAKGQDLWYDPVFRVETLDGRHVWCKRHYRVRPGKVPGTFRFSVLDNGVTSDEFWTIVGAADDLSWIVFHYAGAAKTVGLSYLGGLLCTPDGSLPESSQLPEIWKCLEKAGIQPWELYEVDNRKDTPGAIEAGPPPLDYYRRAVLERKAAAATASAA